MKALSGGVALGMAVASAIGLASRLGDPREAATVRGASVTLFGDGVYAWDTLFKGAGNVGSDVVSLVVALPVLVVAIVRYRKDDPAAGLFLAGALAWPLYLYATLSVGTAFNTLFLVYVAIFSASLFAFVPVITSIDLQAAEIGLARLPARGIGIFMMICGVVTLTVWLLPLLGALASGEPPRLLGSNTTMVTDAIDLAIITPLTFVGGLRLVRGDIVTGFRIVTPLLMLLCVLGPAIIAQTIVQLRVGVHFEPGEVAGPMTGFLVLSAVAVILSIAVLRAAGRREAAPHTH